jgi:hypothetical protein
VHRQGTLRRVLAALVIGPTRTVGKLADPSMALTGRFTAQHALMCRLHLDRIKVFDDAVAGLQARIAAKPAPRQRGVWTCSRPFPGSATRSPTYGWPRSTPPRTCTSPAPQARLLGEPVPGDNISARKRKHNRTGDTLPSWSPTPRPLSWTAKGPKVVEATRA